MHMRGLTSPGKGLASGLDAMYRNLFDAEARLAEVLAQRRGRIERSLIEQWPVLEEFLHLYARDLSPAGCLVLAGRPDEGSRLTGLPFTGPAQARERLELSVTGDQRSRAGDAFWMAVDDARRDEAPLETLFATLHLAHAIPFSATIHAPEIVEASIAHVTDLLSLLRPQVVVAVGADALTVLGHAARSEALEDFARTPESAWAGHWPPGTRMLAYPRAEAGGASFRVVPLPSLEGAEREWAVASLAHVIDYVWA